MIPADVVDILCIGSGSAVLAAGLAGADRGLKVVVAEPSREAAARTRPVPASGESWATLFQRRWGVTEFHSTTAHYLEEMTSSLGSPAPAKAHGHLPIDTVETFSGVNLDPTGAVPVFCGADLARWAGECLNSPFGLIFSRVRQSSMTEVRKVDGTTITAELVAPTPTARPRELTMRQWLSELARGRGVAVQESCSVQRLLFNEGQLVGAVLETPDGVRAIRARHGVVLGTSYSTRDDASATLPIATDGGATLCVVGRTASRFARLEILVSAESYSMYASAGRLA